MKYVVRIACVILCASVWSSCKGNKQPEPEAKEPEPTELDFHFEGSISEKVLKNYLSRSLTFSFISVPYKTSIGDISVILNTGAKYISRAIIPWEAETGYAVVTDHYKAIIDNLH